MAWAHCVSATAAQPPRGIIASERFAGGSRPGRRRRLRPQHHAAGIGDYSQRDIERILETGDMPDGDSVGGLMAAVVANTSKLSAHDRARDRALPQIAAAGPKARNALEAGAGITPTHVNFPTRHSGAGEAREPGIQ